MTLLLDSAHLEVALSGAERALTLQRDNVRVDRADITKVQLTDDLWTWLRGVRSPGLHVRGRIAAGTWRSVAGADFVLVRGRKPGVVIDLNHDAPFQRLVLTTSHGLALVKALRLDDVTEEASDVVTLTSPIPVIKPRRAPKPATA